MQFKEPYSAVLITDDMGGCEVRIRVPEEVARDIVFHYQLRFAPKELRHETEYKGAKLDRFVFQSMLVDEVIYAFDSLGYLLCYCCVLITIWQ